MISARLFVKRPGKKRFVFRRADKLFYLLNILFGARKQIFLTFAPWVLVTVYGASPARMASLALASAAAGVTLAVTQVSTPSADAIAAEIRGLRPPEPYKGKGIRYSGEIVRRKAGKQAKAVAAA